MLCDDCVNVIMRTTQNGTQDPVTARVCSLDGAHMTYQLKECSRKKKMVKEEVPVPDYASIDVLKKAKPIVTMEEFANPPVKEIKDNFPGTKGFIPPRKEVAKRGRRGT